MIEIGERHERFRVVHEISRRRFLHIASDQLAVSPDVAERVVAFMHFEQLREIGLDSPPPVAIAVVRLRRFGRHRPVERIAR